MSGNDNHKRFNNLDERYKDSGDDRYKIRFGGIKAYRSGLDKSPEIAQFLAKRINVVENEYNAYRLSRHQEIEAGKLSEHAPLLSIANFYGRTNKIDDTDKMLKLASTSDHEKAIAVIVTIERQKIKA